jgi:replicative DNA helicase
MSIIDKAKKNLNAGLSVIPTRADKHPALIVWKRFQIDRMDAGEAQLFFSGGEVKGLAILCGAVSGNLEVIDVDCKYDLSGTLWADLKSLIDEQLPQETARNLVVVHTKNKGYHIYYRSEVVEGNLNLACRNTTDEEKEESYKKAIAQGETPEKAERQGKNDKTRLLIGTRGEGNYVIAPPTPSYEFIQGDPLSIPRISKDEREILFTLARSFNEVFELESKQYINQKSLDAIYEFSPFDEYNQIADVVELLENHGWAVERQSGDRIYLKKQGASSNKTSAIYHSKHKFFYVFDTTPEFNKGKVYNPTAIYTILECNGDYNLANKNLSELGYGERRTAKNKQNQTQAEIKAIRVEGIKQTTESITLAKPGYSLKAEKVKAVDPEKVYIYYVSQRNLNEVLRVLDFLEHITEARIYLTQVDNLDALDNKQLSQPAYEFKLQALLKNYNKIEETKGFLEAEDIDKFLYDAVAIASNIPKPVDRDRFAKLFTSIDIVKNLGVTEESLKAAEDELRYKVEQEKMNKSLARLLEAGSDLRERGQLKEAFTKLDEGVQASKRDYGKELLPAALNSEDILRQISQTVPAFKTGYKSLDRFVGFTPGTITLIAGRPSHGKTTFLFNLLLEMSQRYGPDFQFYYFTYEEPLKNLSIKLLNRLIGDDLSQYYNSVPSVSSINNYEFLKAYLKAERTDINIIEQGKEMFRTLIDSGIITVIDRNYSVEQLNALIGYLNHKKKIGAVFIDYIQRIRTELNIQDKKTEIAYIADKVSELAKVSNLPLIIGCQMNRSTDGFNKKPTVNDLQNVGSLEDYANTILCVYNENQETDDKSDETGYPQKREVDLEIKVLKNRDGEINRTAVLAFDKWTGLLKEKKASANHS